MGSRMSSTDTSPAALRSVRCAAVGCPPAMSPGTGSVALGIPAAASSSRLISKATFAVPMTANSLRRQLRTADGLAIVVGIIIGSGIFRTPGIVAAQLGRPWLTFVAWVLGGALALCGALVFAELATRLPQAGGKYVYAREAFGHRAGFVIGWVESLGLYTAAIAAIATVAAEYVGRLAGLPVSSTRFVAIG